MATRILLAPVGAGKTETVLSYLIETLNERPFAKVWALLATKRQEEAFRQRLIEAHADKQVFFNVEFFNFYELYQHLLTMAGIPNRQLADSARYALLRSVIQGESLPPLQVYHTIASTPGFIRIMADFIYELKQNRIYPEDLAATAQTAKDHDLAAIYGSYQAVLQQYDLVDREGQGWLAFDALADNPYLSSDLDLLLVDGFDQFNSVQADLLSLLADRSKDTLITMTAASGREKTIGRRFTQARTLLDSRFQRPLEPIYPDGGGVDDRHEDLQHLIANIFLRDAEQRTSTGGLHLIETPDTAAEVGMVLRRVKRLLLNDTKPDDILIALRDWERYRIHFATLADEYGLPLALHYGLPLSENPLIAALMALFSLHEGDFPRRDLLDVLRSPYFQIPNVTDNDAALLAQISQQATITRGRDAWQDAILESGTVPHGDEDPDDEAEPLLSRPEAAALHANIAAFFQATTPPETATLDNYILWVEQLIGQDIQADPDEDDPEAIPPLPEYYTLNVIPALRAAPEAIIARDLAALNDFKRVLRGLLSAQELLQAIDSRYESRTDWETFSTDLRRAVESASIDPNPNRAGRVLVTTAANARGLPHPHVFILGLSEGLFPMQIPEDRLYLDSERQQMQTKGIYLQTRAERAADDGLFYELICLPRETLTLSRPTMQEGKLWAESPLWRATRAVFTEATTDGDPLCYRLPIGATVPVHEVAAWDEAAVAVMHTLDGQSDINAYPWLTETPFWGHIITAQHIEQSRMSRDPFDRYSGRLSSPVLIAQVSQKLNPGRVWSASQLNDYGVCGFRFFAKRMLKLEALEEPEEGLDVLQQGSINHAILEGTYRRLHEADIPITPEYASTAIDILKTVARDVFEDAPQRFGFRANALWEQDKKIILRKLVKLVEVDFSDENPIMKKFKITATRRPYLLEEAFGMDSSDTVWVYLGSNAGSIKVRGFIDRIDRLGENTIIVIDYKSGSADRQLTDLESGRDVQMLVYLEGAKAVLPSNNTMRGGGFYLIGNRKISGVVDLADNGAETIETAKQTLDHNISQGRIGDFSVRPTKVEEGKCVHYCELHQLCRVRNTHRYKREGR